MAVPTVTATSGPSNHRARTVETSERGPAHLPQVTVNSADDIVDVLIAQHQQLRQLCTHVQAATGDDRKRLFGDLTLLVHLHELGEKTVVHPVTRDHTQRSGDAVATACAAQEEQAGQAIAALEVSARTSRAS